MKIYVFTILIFGSILLNGCGFLINSTEYVFMDKENRKVKKTYKYLNKQPSVLYATTKGAVSGMSFILRESNFFEVRNGVMFWTEYYFGKWERPNNSDSIIFHYFDKRRIDHIDTIAVFYKDKSGIDGDDRPYKSTLEFRLLDTSKRYPLDFGVNYNKIF